MNKTIFLILIIVLGASALFAQERTPIRMTFVPENVSIELLNEEQGMSLETYDKLISVHRITGYTAMGLGLLSSILNPNITDERVHMALGIATSSLSAVSLGLGAVSYAGLEPDDRNGTLKLHAILGITGGALMMVSPLFLDQETGSHGIIGTIGALTMSASVILQLTN